MLQCPKRALTIFSMNNPVFLSMPYTVNIALEKVFNFKYFSIIFWSIWFFMRVVTTNENSLAWVKFIMSRALFKVVNVS